jgi:hypothetical protein
MSSQAVMSALRESGPLTGAELLERTGMEALELWRECTGDPDMSSRVVGRRFLRLDRAVEGYARLSPSIRREFLTYTLLDLADRQERLNARAERLAADIVRISAAKRRLAGEAVASAVAGMAERDLAVERACYILAGDITYDMAHRVSRPEHSTGKMVRGSDLDIIVVTDDDVPTTLVEALDEAIYKKKYFLLVSPSYREEIDYLIKNLAAVHRQVRFDTFESMVACKILTEGEQLFGSRRIFETLKALLAANGIPERLDRMAKEAVRNRSEAESALREDQLANAESASLKLFYTTEEGDEIY